MSTLRRQQRSPCVCSPEIFFWLGPTEGITSVSLETLRRHARSSSSGSVSEVLNCNPGPVTATDPGSKRKFLYNLSGASYQKNWGKAYQPPTFGERMLAFLVRILPKIGPLRVLQLQTPTPQAERLFEASFDTSLQRYRNLLDQEATGHLDLPNDNFDTGGVTGPGKYRPYDETQAELLDALAKQNFSGASSALRNELLEFFGHPDAPYATKRKPNEWAQVQVELEQLRKAASPVAVRDARDL
jgi:hypothetical protein